MAPCVLTSTPPSPTAVTVTPYVFTPYVRERGNDSSTGLCSVLSVEEPQASEDLSQWIVSRVCVCVSDSGYRDGMGKLEKTDTSFLMNVPGLTVTCFRRRSQPVSCPAQASAALSLGNMSDHDIN